MSALHGPTYVLAGLCGLLVIFAIVMLLRRRREHGDPGGHDGPGSQRDRGGLGEHGGDGAQAERAGQRHR